MRLVDVCGIRKFEFQTLVTLLDPKRRLFLEEQFRLLAKKLLREKNLKSDSESFRCFDKNFLLESQLPVGNWVKLTHLAHFAVESDRQWGALSTRGSPNSDSALKDPNLRFGKKRFAKKRDSSRDAIAKFDFIKADITQSVMAPDLSGSLIVH